MVLKKILRKQKSDLGSRKVERTDKENIRRVRRLVHLTYGSLKNMELRKAWAGTVNIKIKKKNVVLV